MTEDLNVSLFGSPNITLDGEPVTGFVSSKARALTFYLAATGRSHTREALAGLLWSDVPDATARKNLRDVLPNLRRLIGPYLLITRQTASFDPQASYTVDSGCFSSALSTARRAESVGAPSSTADLVSLSQAVDLYQGDFLAGFYVPDAPLFEEWVLGERESMARALEEALQLLVRGYSARGEYKLAISCTQRWLSLDPLRETAHRALVELYVWDGDRAADLRQYETCVQVLQDELGVEPAPETAALCERIREGEFQVGGPERAVRRIQGYEVRERIGEGGFGVVYRAYQAHVGREVAVKVILPQFANHPDFIRRFEAEAQLVARLEHPYIVPLYDYWRQPDGAYLVMRCLRGGSLKSALERGPWKPEATLRLIDQIAAALDFAHRQGTVHRDIKPANILLDEQGNAFLSDFGIARDLERSIDPTPGDTIIEYTAYSSPEQVQEGPVTSQSDIYSLGVMLCEVLTGAHPSPEASLATNASLGLPPAVNEVIQRATVEDPARRFPDALSLAAALRQAFSGAVILEEPGTRAEGASVAPTNPYRGLRTFLEADAANFFVREALTEKLVARLAPAPSQDKGAGGQRFLAVVGPSGSGKSSVVRAGLVPALREGAIPGSQNWYVIQMLPGAHPLEEMETALLRVAVNPPESLINQMREDERGLLRAVKRTLPDDDSELLLVIDQFEELFTLVQDDSEREQFLNGLQKAVDDPWGRLRVVVTLRGDFYDRPLEVAGIGELVSTGTEVVLPLSPAELERAIAGPAKRANLALEPGLLAQIVADVTDQPGGLPLLQYALTELFDRRESSTLTLQAYHAVGGVAGALGRRAEELYAGLDAPGQEMARQVFLRLIALGEGPADRSPSPETRRRVGRAELKGLEVSGTPESSDVLDRVIDLFGRHRLLTFDRDPLTRGPTVEVAHEALLRAWKRLGQWLDDYRADMRMQRVLADGAAEWLEAERDQSFLLRGSRLDQFEGWIESTELALTTDERTFLEASSVDRRRLDEARRAQQERELALERSAVRRLRVIVGVLLVASALGIILTVAVFRQSQAAQRQAHIATARELAAAAASNLEVDPERSVLLELEAADVTYPEDGTVLPEVETVLHRAVSASHLLHTIPGGSKATVSALDWVTVVKFSPDGTRLAAIHAGAPIVTIRDASTFESLVPLLHAGVVWGHLEPSPSVTPYDIAFSPDGSRVATSDLQKTVHLYNAATGAQLFKLSGGHTGRLNQLNFSPDGTRLATSSQDGTAVVWEIDTRKVVLTLRGHGGPVRDVAYSPDGIRLVTAGDDATARIWDAASGEELLTLTGHTNTIMAVAISADGTLLATAGADGTAKVWALATGKELLSLTGHSDGLNDVAFGKMCATPPKGGPEQCSTQLATASADGTAKVWNLATGKETISLAGHTDQVFSVAFSPDGTRLATGALDRSVKIWDIRPDRELLSFVSGTVYDMAVSPRCAPDSAIERCETRLATSSARGTATVWDISDLDNSLWSHDDAPLKTGVEAPAAAGEELLTVSDDDNPRTLSLVEVREDGSRVAPGVTFSPNRSRLATAGSDGTASVWDAGTGQRTLILSGHSDLVNGIAFSTDGELLATASEDGTAKIWDAVTGAELFTLSGHIGRVNHVVFSPAGARETAERCGTRVVTTGSDDTAIIWDADSGARLHTLLGHTDRVSYAAFSPDGAYLATASADGSAKVWDPTTGEELLTLAGHTNAVNGIAYNRAGTRIATASADGTARVWDAQSGEQSITISTHPVGVGRVAFSHDGTRLITANHDNTVRVYALDIKELMGLARQRVTRSLTDEECQQYLHMDECPPTR